MILLIHLNNSWRTVNINVLNHSQKNKNSYPILFVKSKIKGVHIIEWKIGGYWLRIQIIYCNVTVRTMIIVRLNWIIISFIIIKILVNIKEWKGVLSNNFL